MILQPLILCLLLLSSGTPVWHARRAPAHHLPYIKLVFSYHPQVDSIPSDTIFYSLARPLKWEDFQGRPSANGPSAAVTYSSFAYEGSSRAIKDTLQINLDMQVFFIKSASWVRADARTAYGLAHEQLHFDITRLVVERFKQRLKQTALNRDDYDSVIQYQYLEAFREMNRLQYAFDRETRHGLDPAAQLRWRDKINVGMKNNGVLPEELGYEFDYLHQ
ncbi:DUF922 domain-containing protein [Chitinophaga vietnamensis]|uniref:DUF922 domain-containing protein n=1 Tax=Chitinophaga vietnamensis TaxID=2593957 RepID=UPI0011775959|nr:hypothetical protein [Chitinophaga vietnamensis]